MTATGSPAAGAIAVGPPKDQIQSVARAVKILAVVGAAEHPGIAARTIAERCGLKWDTMYHLVRTLAYYGFLQRWDSCVNGISTQTYTLGFAILDRAQELSTVLMLETRHRSAEEITHTTGRTRSEVDCYLAQAAALARPHRPR